MRGKALRPFTGVAPMVACILGLAGQVRADGANDPVCPTELAPKAPTTDFPLLYQPRHDELTLESEYLGSSLPLRSAFEGTLMYSLARDDQRVHLGARVGFATGNWGADKRGPIALGLGGRAALDFARPLSGILDVYGFVQADVLLLAQDGDDVLRPDAGLGIRVARAVAVEAGFAPLVSLGGPFTQDDRFAAGFAVGLSFDFCTLGTACYVHVPPQVSVDLTQQLYDRAAALAPTDPAEHAALCKAVQVALDGGRYAPHDEVDSTEAFLVGLEQNVADGTLKAKLQALAAQHKAWRERLVLSRTAARTAAASDRLLQESCAYAPLPSEIRTELGCDGAAAAPR